MVRAEADHAYNMFVVMPHKSFLSFKFSSLDCFSMFSSRFSLLVTRLASPCVTLVCSR